MPSALIDSFIDTYAQALADQNAAIFAGAGLSIPAGMVDWKGLLKNIAREIGLDVKKEDDLITVAQFHYNEHGGRHKINQALIHEFARRAKLTENHRILARLPIRTYWTTNYDTLIEESLKEAGKTPDVKTTVANLATTLPRRDAVVYKMHGDIAQPDKAVVTKDDYRRLRSVRNHATPVFDGPSGRPCLQDISLHRL
jgi:NAD-dependent SIR2 family protein deacetylase